MSYTKIQRNSATGFPVGQALAGKFLLMLGQLRFPAKPDTLLGCNGATLVCSAGDAFPLVFCKGSSIAE